MKSLIIQVAYEQNSMGCLSWKESFQINTKLALSATPASNLRCWAGCWRNSEKASLCFPHGTLVEDAARSQIRVRPPVFLRRSPRAARRAPIAGFRFLGNGKRNPAGRRVRSSAPEDRDPPRWVRLPPQERPRGACAFFSFKMFATCSICVFCWRFQENMLLFMTF